MEYLVCYDIVNDDLRKKVSDVCQNKGMVRIQYSVFYGDITRNKVEELEMEIKNEIKGYEAVILILQVCEKCSKRKKIIEETSQEEEEKKKTEKSKEKEKEKEKKGVILL